MVGGITMSLRLSKRIARKLKGTTSIDPSLDVQFYRQYYSDLTNLEDETLQNHWAKFGRNEHRFANKISLLKAYGIYSTEALNFDLDLDFYLNFYPDLKENGVTSELQAKIHWLTNGKKEKRIRTLSEWKQLYAENSVIEIAELDISSILAMNPSISLNEIASTLCGHLTKTITFYKNIQDNADFYYTLATKFLALSINQGRDPWYQAALIASRIAYNLVPDNKYLEYIGEIHLANGDDNTACQVFAELDNRTKTKSNLFYFHYVKALLGNKRAQTALDTIDLAINQSPHSSFLYGLQDECIQQFYWSNLGRIQLLANLNDREELKIATEAAARRIYDSYFNRYQVGKSSTHKHPDLSRVLIIGDYHVPQCVRYRIKQKVQQLEKQNISVEEMDWTKLTENQNTIALYDLVIFYRVPAEPNVLKAIAQVNATGRYSFYEIDDLLFDTSYPAPIETYGDYLDINTHIELRKSMGSFYAAAKCCQYGIASTLPLADKLEKLVNKNRVLLHRNGLDEVNKLTVQYIQYKDNELTIFYGSGTQAHNSDFIEQALPALSKILKQHKHVRLVIAGYLQLPKEFLKQFSEQVTLMPPVKNVRAYWQYLEQADINLAVLLDDEINGCKSELKWFEAACFNIPSVVSSTQNYRDVLENGKDAMVVNSPEAWFEALNQLVKNTELRKMLGERAHKKVLDHYSIEALGQNLVSQFTQLTEETAPTKKRKIALVNVFFPPQSIGGATRVLADNFDILQQQYGEDFELVVFTSDERCTTPHRLETYQYNGVPVYRSTVIYREHMDWHPKDDKMYEVFNEFLEAEKPDLVHFHCVQRLTGSVVEAAKDAEIPYLITAHDAWWISDYQFLVDQFGKVYSDGHPDIFAKRALPVNITQSESLERLAYFRDLLEGASQLITVSESFAELYKKNGYPQIKVTKNGISNHVNWQTKDTSYTDKVVCGHIGGMSEHKGYFLLKEAVEQLQPANIEMLIVDHSKPEGWEKLTTWGAVPVRFIGRVAQKDIVPLYQKVDVLFAPSTWPESYGLVTREAAACSCWVVASDMGGIGEDIVDGKSGFKISPTTNSLTKVLKQIDHKFLQFKTEIKQADIRKADKQVEQLVELYK
jgi:glycosyltransferase involved in cell wall biosynthesis